MHESQSQPEPTIKFQIRMSIPLKQTLDAAAAARKISSSHLVKLALADYLGISHDNIRKPPTWRERQTEKRRKENELIKLLSKPPKDLYESLPPDAVRILEELNAS